MHFILMKAQTYYFKLIFVYKNNFSLHYPLIIGKLILPNSSTCVKNLRILQAENTQNILSKNRICKDCNYTF